MKQTLSQRIAMLFPASGKRLTEDDNFNDSECQYLESELPSGSGIDSGMTVDIELSTRKHLVLRGDFHRMDDNGYYCGWFSFRVNVTSDIAYGTYISDIRFSPGNAGLSRNDLDSLFGDYLADIVQHAISEPREVIKGDEHCVFA